MNYAYIVRCADGTYYAGWTNDLARRLENHNSGVGGRYTRARCPVELVYSEEFPTKQQAQSRECAIKRMSRRAKEQLIADKAAPDQNIAHDLIGDGIDVV